MATIKELWYAFLGIPEAAKEVPPAETPVVEEAPKVKKPRAPKKPKVKKD